MDHKIVKHFIGIDIAKLTIDVAVISLPNTDTPCLTTKCSNDFSGFRQLKKQLLESGIRLNRKSIVIFESMGFYQKSLLDFLEKSTVMICVESATRVIKSSGIIRGKTDKIDAQRLAEYALLHRQKLRIWRSPREILFTIKDLLATRKRFIKARVSMKTQLSEMKSFFQVKQQRYFNKLNKPGLEGILESETLIENELLNIVNGDEGLKKEMTLLTSIPGIGFYAALNLIYFTNEFMNCTNGKQLASYCGVVPFERSSGTSLNLKPKVSFFCNHTLKTALHMAALSVVRQKNGEFAKYFNRKVAEGKARGSVVNAVKNKLILRAFAVIKNERPYEREYSFNKGLEDPLRLAHPLPDVKIEKKRVRIKKAVRYSSNT